ncbi:MAG TPA: TPM domain-containing protein [Methylomirabilota bacterium]|nr:TPM domain-containing protein [Methylomirabilota bacterium]
MKRRHPSWTHRLLSDADLERIAAAVAAAEHKTSGEIRVHLERRLPRRGTALARATEVFRLLGMQATAEHNGVLIYLAVDDHKLAIVGDAGVHGRVGDGYWQHVRDAMVERLRRGEARDAVLHAVDEVGLVLRRLFPRRPDDDNELSDRVSVS